MSATRHLGAHEDRYARAHGACDGAVRGACDGYDAGLTALLSGRVPEARSCLERSLSGLRERGNGVEVGKGLALLGLAQFLQGQTQDAGDTWDEAARVLARVPSSPELEQLSSWLAQWQRLPQRAQAPTAPAPC